MSPTDLVTELSLCFSDRAGDVYARPIRTPEHLLPTGTSCDAFFAPLPPDDELRTMFAALL